jgi:O-antigen biosynthesis protein
MKILYLPGEYPFCYYYRGYLPGVYSEQMVVKEFLVMRRNSPVEEIQRQARMADVVVLQRPKEAQSLNLVRSLKAAGKKVIFENDDTYLLGKGVFLEKLQNDKQREIVKMYDKYIKEILKECDGAIASTPILAKEYAEFNPNVAVLKNCIDPLDEFPCKPNTTGKFRVGFIGSVTTNDDYIHIKDQIKRLDERGDVTIVVLGVKYKDGKHLSYMEPDYQFWNSLKNIEWHPYVNVTEYMSTIADLSLDLAIIPRQESYFNRCKSNLKFLEMSLLRIPVIAQGFSTRDGPYDGEDAAYMTVMYDDSKWYDQVVEIKESYEKYKQLAEKAHDYVLQNYNIATYAHEWTKTIKKLCK